MDYRNQIEEAKRAAEKWREEHPIVGVGELRVDLMVEDLTASVTGLLERAEIAEARLMDLETTHRTEMCESGYDCVELGNVRKALETAEAKAERAEKCIDKIRNAVEGHRWHMAVAAVKAFYIEKGV